MVKNKELEYWSWNQNEGVEIFKMFESDLSDMHF
jgi:hypothetical protein